MPRKRMDLQTVDQNPGEVVEGILVWTQRTRHSLFSKEGFVAMSQSAADMLAQSDLDGTSLKVLWKLLAKLDMENWIYISHSEMAAEMGLQKQNFHRSIKRLLEEGIILEGPKVGRNKTYRLNPNYGWKGSTQGHVVALENHPLKTRMKQSKIESVITGGKEISDYEAAERAGQQRLFDMDNPSA